MSALRLLRARRVTATFIGIAVALSSGSCASSDKPQAEKFCAIMPDSIGLYVDNPVTQMGYEIGKIAAITPDVMSVRVEFTIDQERPLPKDVKAVTRSTSILADRSLELVGNYESGPQLTEGGCIPLNQSLTPKSLSEVVGSSTTFIDSINPTGSDNVGEVVTNLDKSITTQGPGINKLLTTTSRVVDSPDQVVGDIGSITNNLAELTTTLVDLEPTLKQVFTDTDKYAAKEIADTLQGASETFEGVIPVVDLAAGLEKELGPQIQQLLDALSVVIRKGTPRAPFYASLLNVAPRVLNGIANLANNHAFFDLKYRPPTYRLKAPEGVLQCNIMNATLPGSCANVKGTPLAVDVALLQYVLTEANNR